MLRPAVELRHEASESKARRCQLQVFGCPWRPSSLPVRTHIPYPTQTRTHTQTALASDLCSSECTVCLGGESGRVSWPPVATAIQRVLRVPRAERVVDQTEDMTACVDDTKCNIWFRTTSKCRAQGPIGRPGLRCECCRRVGGKGAGEAMYGSLRCLCLSSQVGRTDPTQR